MEEPKVDRDFFYANFPSSKLFGKKINPSRRAGFEAIFDEWDAIPQYDFAEWLAYALATAWHETGGEMQPVREGFAKTDKAAYDHVTAYCRDAGIDNYARRHANGNSYYGRGYVQLTHSYNYEKAGARLGVGKALYDQPDRVMEPGIAGRILLTGMIAGSFRPAHGSLVDYFNGAEQRWFEARDLINGDKHKVPKWTNGKSLGELIAGYGRAFRGALRLV